MSSKPLNPGKTPMKAKIQPVHSSYRNPNPTVYAKEKCHSCTVIAAAVSVGILMAMVAILLS